MNLSSVFTTAYKILNGAIPVILSLGVVYFIWGVISYVIADAEEAKKTGKDRIIYGIVGLTAIIGLGGLINLAANTFGLNNSVSPSVLRTTCSQDIGGSFKTLVDYVVCNINNSVIPLLFALAFAIFIWGVIKFFIINADEEAKRTQGKQFMLWGIISLTVMLCVWGLVEIIVRTLSL